MTDVNLAQAAQTQQQPPQKLLGQITSHPALDPYLAWAHATNLRDFSIDSALINPYFQVAAQCSDVNPLKIKCKDLEWPHLGLREICKTADSKSLVLTGLVDKTQLTELLSKCDQLEFNVPRYRHESPAGGGATDEAKPAALGKRVVAVIDFGCPFAHKQFWDSWNETTRVRYFWDQDALRTIRNIGDKTDPGKAEQNEYWFINKRFRYGRETTSEELKPLFRRCMQSGVVDEDMAYDLADYEEMHKPTSHGAHVLDLAAGRINPMSGREDDASEADIIFVQLPRDAVADTSGGSMTMYVLDALDYILSKTQNVDHLVINMSFGSTAGPHDGTSLLERGMDNLIIQERGKRKGQIQLVLPAGNHFLADLHGALTLTKDQPSGVFQWEVMPDDATENYLELWCEAETDLKVVLTSPTGDVLSLDHSIGIAMGLSESCGLVRATGSAAGKGEVILVALGPTSNNCPVRVASGVWSVQVSAKKIAAGTRLEVDAWVERDDPLPWQSGQPQCRLISSTVGRDIDALDTAQDVVKRSKTGNSLAYGSVPIVVGGYVVNSAYTTPLNDAVLSSFSAAGYFTGDCAYIAPSDETDALEGIWAASNRSDTMAKMNGTSVSAPQVARQLLNSPDKRRIRYPMSPHPLGDMRDQRGSLVPRVY